MEPLGGKRKHWGRLLIRALLIRCCPRSQSDLSQCVGRGQIYLWSKKKMAKKRSKQNKDTGERKPRKSAAQKQKQREKDRERMAAFNKTNVSEMVQGEQIQNIWSRGQGHGATGVHRIFRGR